MKKVGILTLPLNDNYGGTIQKIALYHFLEKEGHQPYLIDKMYNQSRLKVLIKQMMTHNPFYKLFDYNNLTRRRKSLKKINAFVDSYFKQRTKRVFDERRLKQVCRGFDAIIVGSDQVWRYKYVKENYSHYFLNFAFPNQKKLSYAASFGIDFWEGNEDSIEKISLFLKEFDAVSVREDSGIKICEETFGYSNATQTLDPTLLPDVSFYESIIRHESIDKDVSLFNYVLDASSNKEKIVKEVSNLLGLDINTIHLQENLKKNKLKPSIPEWLYHFKHADYIITDSFHGMVFSIIFHKQFIAIGNKVRGVSRFTSLLKQLGLESRLIFEGDEEKVRVLIGESIDYNGISEKLDELKVNSTTFLRNSL